MSDLKSLLSELTNYTGLLEEWETQRKALKNKKKNINIVDFDDTIFSRKEVLESNNLLKRNRGAKGNEIIINTIGINNFIAEYYTGKKFPKDIVRLLKKHDCIMTAGIYELQKSKIQVCNLKKFNHIIVTMGSEKIIATIRYVLYDLAFIPETITIYEDRPEFFIEYKRLIQGVLGCKLIIKNVEMDENNGYKKIEEVDEKNI